MNTQPTSLALTPGTRIAFHGAVYQIETPRQTHHHADSLARRDYNMERPVYTATGVKVGGADGMPQRWDFQGNDLARWFIAE